MCITEAGIEVLLLVAGRDYDPVARERPCSTRIMRSTAARDQHLGEKFWLLRRHSGWGLAVHPGEPHLPGPGSRFMWWRARMLGGAPTTGARPVPRLPRLISRSHSVQMESSTDRPVDYEEIAPSGMTSVRHLIGVCGDNPGLDDTPSSSEGVPVAAARAPGNGVAAENQLVNHWALPAVPMRRAILTEAKDDRQACFWATPCGRGCAIGAAFQTTTSVIPGRQTGNLKIVTNAMVKEVHLDDSGKASGVTFVNRLNREDVRVDAGHIILAASACETARLLLPTPKSGEAFPERSG